MAIEIVDLPIDSMVIFQFAMLNYQRVANLTKDGRTVRLSRITPQIGEDVYNHAKHCGTIETCNIPSGKLT